MSSVAELIGELEKKVDKNDLPKLMKILLPIQTATAMQAVGAVKQKNLTLAESAGRTFLKSITPAQWPQLEVLFGKDLVAKFKAVV